MPGTNNVKLIGRELGSTKNVIIIGRSSSDAGASSNLTPRIDISLLGTKNGVNHIFTTPEPFVHTATVTIRVYWNGRRLEVGRDFEVSESGGVGTGYDTITMTMWNTGKKYLPNSDHVLVSDYYIQL